VNVITNSHSDPRLPVDDHVKFIRGPFDGQKFRVPFGKPRTVECALTVGNQIALYRPVWGGKELRYFEFVQIVDKVKSP
jgi:hypothetical protein